MSSIRQKGTHTDNRKRIVECHIKEAPGCYLTYNGMSRKDAIARALDTAPGCTFSITERYK